MSKDPLNASDYCLIIGTGLLAGSIGGPPAALAGCMLAAIIVGVKKK